jgi:hypothetical protein
MPPPVGPRSTAYRRRELRPSEGSACLPTACHQAGRRHLPHPLFAVGNRVLCHRALARMLPDGVGAAHQPKRGHQVSTAGHELTSVTAPTPRTALISSPSRTVIDVADEGVTARWRHSDFSVSPTQPSPIPPSLPPFWPAHARMEAASKTCPRRRSPYAATVSERGLKITAPRGHAARATSTLRGRVLWAPLDPARSARKSGRWNPVAMTELLGSAAASAPRF